MQMFIALHVSPPGWVVRPASVLTSMAVPMADKRSTSTILSSGSPELNVLQSPKADMLCDPTLSSHLTTCRPRTTTKRQTSRSYDFTDLHRKVRAGIFDSECFRVAIFLWQCTIVQYLQRVPVTKPTNEFGQRLYSRLRFCLALWRHQRSFIDVNP